MRDILQAQTEGTTSAQLSAGTAEDHPANVVKYSYPSGDTGFTDVVPQDTPTGELPSGGYDIPADSAPITQLHRHESTFPTDIADKLKAFGNSDGTTHTYIPSQAAEASSGTDGSDTSSIVAHNDGVATVDSGVGASAEASTDSLVEVTPLTDADLVEGTDEAPLVADNQVSGDETPKKAKKAVS